MHSVVQYACIQNALVTQKVICKTTDENNESYRPPPFAKASSYDGGFSKGAEGCARYDFCLESKFKVESTMNVGFVLVWVSLVALPLPPRSKSEKTWLLEGRLQSTLLNI